MSERNIIAIHDVGPRGLSLRVPDASGRLAAPLQDRHSRPLRDLRISVTDRCNFRCSYCMPKEVFDKTHRFLPHRELLSFEEITRVARIFVDLGVRKIRLTGGEPLLRKHIEGLIEQLAALRTTEGDALDLTLTTNGSLLERKARALRDAGLRRVTVSLDAMDDAIFRRMNDVDFPVAAVLAGIDAALQAGLGPVKVNMVVKRGSNDAQILPMVQHFRSAYGPAVALRFIEYMDVGVTNGWRLDEVLPSEAVRALIDAAYPLEPLEAAQPGETAQRWAFRDGRGEVGFISSVTQAFCGDCNRIRLSTEGQLFLCLFAGQGHDLRALLRSPRPDGRPWSDAELSAAIDALWRQRGDRYSELRASFAAQPDAGVGQGARRVEMSYIGG